MIDRILKDWTLFRWIRLLIGGFLLTDGIISGIWPMAVFGLLFTLLPVFNFGCCSTGCSTDLKYEPDDFDGDVIYEELKVKKD